MPPSGAAAIVTTAAAPIHPQRAIHGRTARAVSPRRPLRHAASSSAPAASSATVVKTSCARVHSKSRITCQQIQTSKAARKGKTRGPARASSQANATAARATPGRK